MKSDLSDTLTSMSISVLASQKTYIKRQAASEGFATPSEYIRRLIGADQKRRAQERLEQLVLEGLDSGDSTPMTKKEWDDIRVEVRKRASGRTANVKR